MTSTTSDQVFKVGIIGPSRVGKTSLIAAVLKDSQKTLKGSPVSLKASDTPTELRLSKHNRDLEGSIQAKELEFRSGALGGTQEKSIFALTLATEKPDQAQVSVGINLLDFPGGWLDPSTRPPERETDWRECKQWIKESSVLLVPIDATVLMEAEQAKHRAKVPTILGTPDVANLVRDWAKARNLNPQEPALLILCPLKCETYFNDNGWGLRDGSKGLFQRVEEFYRTVIDAAKEEAPHCQIKYCPIDTLGCVEVKKAHWQENSGLDVGVELDVHYMLRNPSDVKPKGADTILINISRQIIERLKQNEEANASDAFAAAEVAALTAKQKAVSAEQAGFFDKLGDWWDDKGWDHRANEAHAAASHVTSANHHATTAQLRVMSVQDAVRSFADLKHDARVRHIHN